MRAMNGEGGFRANLEADPLSVKGWRRSLAFSIPEHYLRNIDVVFDPPEPGSAEMTPGPALMTTDIDLPLFHRGRFGDTYELVDDQLLMIATDRISAFDVILPNGIPDKGKVLNPAVDLVVQPDALLPGEPTSSRGWSRTCPVPSSTGGRSWPGASWSSARRSGSTSSAWYAATWREAPGPSNKESGTIAGEEMPKNLVESEKLATPIFTPATKNDSGHDENVPFQRMADELGRLPRRPDPDRQPRPLRLRRGGGGEEGLILADTKFEFGLIDNRLILIDEALDPGQLPLLGTGLAGRPG